MMLTLKYDPARTELISRFMDSYLMLNEAESVVYTEEAQTLSPEEKELDMLYRNEWEREGRIKGRIEVIQKYVMRRFGELPAAINDQINHLSDAHSIAFTDVMYDFASLADVTEWFASHESVQPTN